jgi:tRNA(fMet)-specific endonuclease VapC
MRAILIDTNVYCDAMRGDAEAVHTLRTFERILMSPIVIGELRSGFKGGKREKANVDQLALFLATPRVAPLTIDETTADYYALVLDELRKQGTPIPTNDLWIAASALQNGGRLATRDRHFLKVPGLLLEGL